MRRQYLAAFRLPFTALAFVLVGVPGPASAEAASDPEPAPAQIAQRPSPADDMRAWATSGLTYCDATVLSKYWRISVTDSKTLVGRKIRSNNRPTLNAALKQARDGAEKSASKRCEFDDTGFSYSDAQKLAKLWKTSVTEAKSRVERKASTGDASVVRQLLKSR